MTDALRPLPLIAARGIDVAHGKTQALFGVDVELHAGEVVALVGPNGAGKSTLLGALVGWHRARAGAVALGGDPLERLDRREVARRVAFVPQDHPADFAFTVRELVALGRIPHL
ncbi:MAG: ABC transporter ATP-binding protein, partial [Deltaproteobacteria bacterium]|nr:ABC transporter ATP-binding protein [Deltaproteobacteria bacterium]